MKMQQSTTVLGLTLESGVLTAVEVKRSNGSVRLLKHLKAPLTLDPLRDEPELAGREIRNLLDQARITTKRCVAGVPAHWALTVHSKVPAIEEQDIPGFLEIEAERGFACNPDELQISTRVYKAGEGVQYASIVGIPRGYLERFEAVLVAAQLKPVSLSIGLTALPGVEEGAVTVEIADSRIDLLLSGSAGVMALRTIDAAFDSEGAERRVQAELLARELRITLGQIPAEVRQDISKLNIFGEHRFAEQLLSDFQTRARVLGLEARHVTRYPAQHHGVNVNGEAAVSSAFSLATQFLSDREVQFEFLPPKPTFWEQVSSKYSSRRLVYAGAAAAIVLLLAAAAFGYQQAQFSKFEGQWAGMKGKVEELEDLQSKVRRFRPWHETNLVTLNIMKRVTEAFPEDGVVSAKTIEIREGNLVSCMGTARDRASLLKTTDKLQSMKQVRHLERPQLRGNAPVQFTFNFQWNEAVSHEN